MLFTMFRKERIGSMVKCSICGRETKREQAVASEHFEFIDGNNQNMDPANLRKTGRISHQCYLCIQVEAASYPPIVLRDENFKRGYEVGLAEAKRWEELEALIDEDVIASLARTFKSYLAEGNEEAMRYCVGSTIGLLVGHTIEPVLDAFLSMTLDSPDNEMLVVSEPLQS